MILIAVLAGLWWTASLATFAISLVGALAQPSLARRRAIATATPPVSLILPVKLVNPGFERAQASVFAQDYLDYELLIGCAEAQSAALDVIAALNAKHQGRARMIRAMAGTAVSPKLNTLATPLAEAAHDVVVTKDSNITFAPDMLRDLLRSLTPGVGLVCAVPVAVRAQGLAGVIEGILINRDARLLLSASALGKGFGVGKVMLFRRSDLQRAGGIAALSYTIAEDSALSKGLAAIGLKTCFADKTVEQEIGARTLRDVYARQARWAVIRRAEEPVSFPLEPLACPLPAACAAALAAPLAGFGSLAAFTLTLLGWFVIELIVTGAKRWEISPWAPLAFVGRDLVLLAAWAKAWTTREVVWAGRKQDVRDITRKPGR